jgi:hypothetical protein
MNCQPGCGGRRQASPAVSRIAPFAGMFTRRSYGTVYRFKTSNRVSDLGIHGGWLRRPVVLVDHASEHLASTDRCVRWHYSGLILVGWSLLTGLVRAVPVVMADVLAQD